ncbi:hypothetical protein L226DRAFT_464509 [Lentinus tigrinus ALCF2SS1-7]|uniref:Uncharacterized protein n=1 Tax=Lentinus tigrinus ALCF2SS1-6 TaxID=1328759 RepID=A0A5C2RYG9_9APHY|nr:hypothetical protein L227DRAFT_508870 [Lentinus tigrinus ALCF2SS1-6]RPD74012.1 hypothetical protein L226DRAFT_464509 [Lentinus tigrinus ALCF2SS1-7]
MALTATAQSALPREPAWDEVVPALRKRLKDESNVLSKRISAASITSNEDLAGQYYVAELGASTSSNYQSKPSAIPRPSLQSSRTADSSSGGMYAGAHSRPTPRARALSQPYPFEPSPSADSPPLSDNTRPISPGNVPKGTRIPVSRARTGSTSSQAQSTYNGYNGRANGSAGYSRHHAEPSESQLYPVDEKLKANSQTSRSTVRIPRHNVSDIFQEQAPFPPNSLSSSQSNFDYGRQTPERMSSESEEHPFEHWYRGDVARNGGVGELRVARRQEMLDIANYGHTLRKASVKHSPSGLSSRSRSNSRGRDMPNGRARTRQRAESVGARESIYIDQEDVGVEAVMDERPPTDFEDDGYEDHVDDYYSQDVLPHPNGSISSPSLDRSDTPTSRTTQNTTRSRIPQPASRSRTTTPTPSKPTRSASESGMDGPSPPYSSPQVPRSASSSKTQALSPNSPPTPSTPTAKRRAKSPANSTPASASKKPKAPPSSMQRRQGNKNEENRRSIGQYPMPEGDEDAIPTWTQPRPANGNWDDVVLPAVAKKKGLQDHYETADGSPKPKEVEPVIEPAPGTFGYDPTKYRKRYSANPEHIPMDEFGHKPTSPTQELKVPSPDPRLASGFPHPPTPQSFDRRAESPPPFSHYASSDTGVPPPSVQAMQPMGTLQPQRQEQQPVVEEDSGGCCKCVIM